MIAGRVDRTHQPAEIFHRAQPCHRADHDLTRCLLEAGHRARAAPCGRRDRRRCRWRCAGSCRRSGARARARPAPAAATAPPAALARVSASARNQLRLRLSPTALVLVETVLMMDQRRQAHRAAQYGVRHHRVHRSPVVAQHQVETLHISAELAVPAERRAFPPATAHGPEMSPRCPVRSPCARRFRHWPPARCARRPRRNGSSAWPCAPPCRPGQSCHGSAATGRAVTCPEVIAGRARQPRAAETRRSPRARPVPSSVGAWPMPGTVFDLRIGQDAEHALGRVAAQNIAVLTAQDQHRNVRPWRAMRATDRPRWRCRGPRTVRRCACRNPGSRGPCC